MASGLGKAALASLREAEAEYSGRRRAYTTAAAAATKAGDAYRAAQCSFAHYNVLQGLWAAHEAALERRQSAMLAMERARRRLDDIRVRAGLHEAAAAFGQLDAAPY
jgi:hypothetical protein